MSISWCMRCCYAPKIDQFSFIAVLESMTWAQSGSSSLRRLTKSTVNVADKRGCVLELHSQCMRCWQAIGAVGAGYCLFLLTLLFCHKTGSAVRDRVMHVMTCCLASCFRITHMSRTVDPAVASVAMPALCYTAHAQCSSKHHNKTHAILHKRSN